MGIINKYGVAGFLNVKYTVLNIGTVKPFQGNSKNVRDIHYYVAWKFLLNVTDKLII